MATRGTVLAPFLQLRVRRLAAQGVPWRRIARDCGVSLSTVAKYAPRRPALRVAA